MNNKKVVKKENEKSEKKSELKSYWEVVKNYNYLERLEGKSRLYIFKNYECIVSLYNRLNEFLNNKIDYFKNNILSLCNVNNNYKNNFNKIMDMSYEMVNDIYYFLENLNVGSVYKFVEHNEFDENDKTNYLIKINNIYNNIFNYEKGLYNKIIKFQAYLFSYYYFVGSKLYKENINNYIYKVVLRSKSLFKESLNNNGDYKKALKDYMDFFKSI